FAMRRAPVAPAELKQRKLTTNPTDNPLWSLAISPDGKYIAYGDRSAIRIKLIETGETHTIPPPLGVSKNALWVPMAWFPDGTKLLVGAFESGHTSGWTVSVLSGTARMLRDNAGVGSVSPKDSRILYTEKIDSSWMGRELWIMGASGEEAHKVFAVDANSGLGSEAWSPDGQRLAYIRFHQAGDKVE